MTVFVLFTALVIVGAALLAHQMGKELGEEHGYVRARKEAAKCPECRVLAARATLRMQHERSRK